MNLLRHIQALHAGQIAIVAGLLAATSAGAFSMLRDAEHKRVASAAWISELQSQLDSLDMQAHICADPTVQLTDSLARAMNRAMLTGTISSSGGLIKPIASGCSEIQTRKNGLQSLKAGAFESAERRRREMLGLGVLTLLCLVVALSTLWVWFEGRRAA